MPFRYPLKSWVVKGGRGRRALLGGLGLRRLPGCFPSTQGVAYPKKFLNSYSPKECCLNARWHLLSAGQSVTHINSFILVTAL